MIEITSAHLKVFSAVCCNLVVVYLVAMLTTNESVTLTANALFVILFWYAALTAERKLEEL